MVRFDAALSKSHCLENKMNTLPSLAPGRLTSVCGDHSLHIDNFSFFKSDNGLFVFVWQIFFVLDPCQRSNLLHEAQVGKFLVLFRLAWWDSQKTAEAASHFESRHPFQRTHMWCITTIWPRTASTIVSYLKSARECSTTHWIKTLLVSQMIFTFELQYGFCSLHLLTVNRNMALRRLGRQSSMCLISFLLRAEDSWNGNPWWLHHSLGAKWRISRRSHCKTWTRGNKPPMVGGWSKWRRRLGRPAMRWTQGGSTSRERR